MKKIMVLFCSLLVPSLGAMEARWNEEEINKQINPQGIPSLIKLCSSKLSKNAHTLEDPSGFLNSLPGLRIDAAYDIISNLPQDIIDAYRKSLIDLLYAKSINPGMKAAIVKRLQMPPSLCADLLDKVIDKKNQHPDKYVLGSSLFEHCKEIQTWENLNKLFALFPISKQTIKSIITQSSDLPLEALASNLEKLGTKIERSPKEKGVIKVNQETLKLALLDLIDDACFDYDLSDQAPGNYIQEDYMLMENQHGVAMVNTEDRTILLPLYNKKLEEIVCATALPDGTLCALLMKQYIKELNCTAYFCEIHNTKTGKTAIITMPDIMQSCYLDTNSNLVVVDTHNHAQAITIPHYYFDPQQIPLISAAYLYIFQIQAQGDHFKRKALPANRERFLRCENDEMTEKDMQTIIDSYKKSSLNTRSIAQDTTQTPVLKHFIKRLLCSKKSLPECIDELNNTIRNKKACLKDNPYPQVIAAEIEYLEAMLYAINSAIQRNIITEIEQEMAQESKEEEENIYN